MSYLYGTYSFIIIIIIENNNNKSYIDYIQNIILFNYPLFSNELIRVFISINKNTRQIWSNVKNAKNAMVRYKKNRGELVFFSTNKE